MSAGGSWDGMISVELAQLAELLGVEQLQLNDHGGISLTREQYDRLLQLDAAGVTRGIDLPVCLHD